MRIIGCEHSGWLRFVDHHETYGPDVIRDFLKSTSCVDTALDLGAGSGRDLGFIHEAFPQAKLYGLEFLPENIEKLKSKNIETHKINIHLLMKVYPYVYVTNFWNIQRNYFGYFMK